MALTKNETKTATDLIQKGAHPKLVARLIERDERVVLDALKAQDVKGPWPDIPSTEPDSTLTLKVQKIIAIHNDHDQQLAFQTAIDTLRDPGGYLQPTKLNLFIKTLVDERDKTYVVHN